jgi:hypothetical protein
MSEPLDLTQFDGITPGEWHADGAYRVQGGGYDVCHIPGIPFHLTDRDSANANARAIAAVPKLIAEVRRLRAEVERKDEALKELANYEPDRHMQLVWNIGVMQDIARAAIKEPQQ